MTTITIPDELYERAAQVTGGAWPSVEALAIALLEEFLDDGDEAERISAQIRSGEMETIPWEQVKAELRAKWESEEEES